MPKSNSGKSKAGRVSIIRAVQTPLGFFVLVVLVVEAIFGIASAFADDAQRSWLIIAMIILIFSLVGIVALLACFRPEALRGERFKPVSKPDSAEQQHAETESAIVDPRVICVVAEQFEELGLDQDIAVLQSEFSGRVTILRKARSDALRDALTASRYDIIHLAGNVDPKSGNFLFDGGDYLRPESLCNLVSLAQAKLVVLASCDSLVLGGQLARVTNMIAATSAQSNLKIRVVSNGQ